MFYDTEFVANMTSKQVHEMCALLNALCAKMSARNRDALTKFLGPQEGWRTGWNAFDKPDFYREYDDRIIGIEHFAANKYAELKKNEYQHFTKGFQSRCKHLYDKWSPKINDSDIREVVGDIVAHVGDMLVRKQVVGDKNMLPSLALDLSKHAGRVNEDSDDGYRHRLQVKFPGRLVQVGCLIEFEGDFSDIVCFEFGRICRNQSGLLPMSHALLLMFSDALQLGFDFIIFYRKRVSFSDQYILEDRTMVFDKILLSDDVPRYIQGEPVYGRIPASAARNLKANTDYFARRNDATKCTDIIQHVQVGGRGIDLRLYWQFVKMALDTWSCGGFCYCDAEMAATVYALKETCAAWRPALYQDSKAGFTCDGIAPIIEDVCAFERCRIEFLLKHAPKKTSSFILSKLFSSHCDINDSSDGAWLRTKALGPVK